MFQSTHPHGVRQRQWHIPCPLACFNPRTHTGCDREAAESIEAVTRVSIHAPTRGATFCVGSQIALLRSFNPRTHTGCDASPKTRRAGSSRFNPRTHTGCDVHFGSDFADKRVVSIHAPTRGATFHILRLTRRRSLFQSTHPHGVRLRSG